jgi:hypothetical protein
MVESISCTECLFIHSSIRFSGLNQESANYKLCGITVANNTNSNISAVSFGIESVLALHPLALVGQRTFRIQGNSITITRAMMRLPFCECLY